MALHDLPLAISILSLSVSCLVAWLTLLRRGQLKITRPSLIVFIYEHGKPKVFLRTLLYTTGKRGQVVESLYLKVRRGESSQTFSYWAYAETTTMMVGSGLRVTEDGVSYNHHFLPPRSGTEFQFLAGTYQIQIYGVVAHNRKPNLLGTFELALSEQQAQELRKEGAAAFFEWGPESQTYHLSVETRVRVPDLDKLMVEGFRTLLGAQSETQP